MTTGHLARQLKLRWGKLFFDCPKCGMEHLSLEDEKENPDVPGYRMGCYECGHEFLIRECELRRSPK